MLTELAHSIATHSGTFRCVEIGKEKNTKTVDFRHLSTPSVSTNNIPSVPCLQDFYSTFESLTLYAVEQSGEAAYHIASPTQWFDLDESFRPWLDGVTEEEAAEFIPAWVADCIVVGEIPHSGNYLLVPIAGTEAGKVYEFEHDGFEFIKLADNLPEFVQRSLDLDSRRLTNIASHLRFIVEGSSSQWWIKEYSDNRGNLIETEV